MKKTFIGYLVLVALISAFSAKTIGEIFGYIPTYTFVIDFFVLISPTVVCGLIRLQSNRLSLLQKCLLSLSMIVTVILTGHEVFTNTMGAKNAIVTCNPHSWNITVMIECIFCLVCILVIRERKEPIRYGEILKKYLDEILIFFFIFCLTRGSFGSKIFISGSGKNSGDIGLLKSKSK